MTASERVAIANVETPLRRSPAVTAPRRWSWPHYLAFIGLPVLFWNAWTVIAWLIDGPTQVTQFRDRDSVAWYGARVLEGLAILGSILVVRYLARGCRRAGSLFTFEVMFCIAGATMFWADFGLHFFQPIFLFSSNFINLTNTCGHIPFVVNPDCGRAPDAIVLFFLIETFVLLACAIGISKLVTRARSRWPGISTPKLLLVVLTISLVATLGEIIPIALNLWTYTGPRWMSFSPGRGTQWNVIAWVEIAMFFGTVSSVYVFRDDKGHTLVERGLERHSPRMAKAITMMALYTCFQFAIWIPGGVPSTIMSFYQDGWAKMPAHLVNDVCDVPGVASGTRYGPCPGSPGFRMPVRHSLPGRSP